jgi:hypothetical protein
MYAKRAMETKGFSLDYVETEEEFMTKLNILVYDQAWIISSHAADWHKRMPKDTHLKQWRQLANVCEKFWKQGGGLFILGENEPFFDHANVVLERFTDVSKHCDMRCPNAAICRSRNFSKATNLAVVCSTSASSNTNICCSQAWIISLKASPSATLQSPPACLF